LAYAVGGFSADERRWLEQLDASPRWAIWRRFVRAPSADIMGGRFVLPFATSLSALTMQIGSAGMKEMAYATVARAALYRSRGERARGDTALREIITFGFHLVDNASDITHVLIGVVIVGIGHGALNDAFLLDGRPEGKEFQARTAIVKTRFGDDSVTAITATELDSRALRRRIIAGVTARRVSRGMRLSYYEELTLLPCTNVRELITGSAVDARTALARSRSSLVRFPSDAAFLDLWERTPVTTRWPEWVNWKKSPATLVARSVYILAHVSGWILHNPRIPGCTGVWFAFTF
jgi:hypothetical protein